MNAEVCQGVWWQLFQVFGKAASLACIGEYELCGNGIGQCSLRHTLLNPWWEVTILYRKWLRRPGWDKVLRACIEKSSGFLNHVQESKLVSILVLPMSQIHVHWPMSKKKFLRSCLTYTSGTSGFLFSSAIGTCFTESVRGDATMVH